MDLFACKPIVSALAAQVDLSDCNQLGDAIFRILSDQRRNPHGYGPKDGCPILRYPSSSLLRFVFLYTGLVGWLKGVVDGMVCSAQPSSLLLGMLVDCMHTHMHICSPTL